MEFLNELYYILASLWNSLYEDVFFWVLNVSVSASLIAGAVIIIRLLLKKAPKAIIVAMWGLVAIRLIFPFSLESVLSLVPSAETVPTEQFYFQEAIGEEYELKIVDNPIYPEEITHKLPGNVDNNSLKFMYLYFAWLTGIGIMSIYAIVSSVILKRKLRLRALYKENIYMCDNIDSPFIFGIFRPKIYIPSALKEEDGEYVIAHEKAHLKRLDHLWKPLGFMLLTVYWFNPIMWVAYILLCRDIEFACDEKVIKEMGYENKKPYSEALINCSVRQKTVSACPLAFGEVGVKQRIRSVLNYKKPAFWVIILAVIASIIVAVCFMTNPKTEEKDGFSETGYRLKVTVETFEGTTQFPAETEEFMFNVEQGTEGELPVGVNFEVIETNLQTGEISLELSGEPLYDTILAEPVEMKNIVVSELTDGISLVTKGYNNFVIFELIKIQDIDQAISQAVYEKYRSLHPRQMGTYSCEAHETLDIINEESVSPVYDEIVKVYIYASYGEYIMLDKSVFCLYGSTSPAVLTFELNDGKYKLVKFDKVKYNDEIMEDYISGLDSLKSLNKKVYNLITKKLSAHYAVESLAYTVTTNSNVTLNVTDIKTDSAEPYIEVEWYNGTNETIETDFVCNLFFAKNTSDSVEWVEYDIFDNIESWNFEKPAIKPYESVLIRYDLSDCTLTSDGGYRLFTQFYNTQNEYEGQAIIDFVIGDVYSEPNTVPDNAIISEEETTGTRNTTTIITTKPHIITNPDIVTTAPDKDLVINDYSYALSWANYKNDGETVVMKCAEKPFYSPYGSDNHPSVAMFETKAGFDDFYADTSDTFSYTNSWDECPSFEDTSAQYDEKFFESYDLLLVYVTDASSDARYSVDKLWRADGTVHINIARKCPSPCNAMMGGWFITVAVPKGTVGRASVVSTISKNIAETSTNYFQ